MEKLPLIRFVFDRRKVASEKNQGPVELEVYFSRQERKFIPTGIQLFPNQWSREEHVINHGEAQVLNHQLSEHVEKITRFLIAMQMDGEEMTVGNLTERLGGRKKKSNMSFIEFMHDQILKRKLRSSTQAAHYAALATLERFGKIKTFQSLTAKNIELFDDFLREEDPTRVQTTIHNYHKRIKPYVRKAFKLNYIDENPYDHFDDVRGEHKEREPLMEEELMRLRSVELSDRLTKARDLFVFCCYTGLAFADMRNFDYHRHVVENHGLKYIDGNRFKNGVKFFTPLLKPALNVLKKYNYRLPIISMQKYNDYLHLIEEKLELNKPLTSHIARHTFATTVALANDIPIESVSRMLGHKHISTTQIYAKILKSSIERHSQRLNELV